MDKNALLPGLKSSSALANSNMLKGCEKDKEEETADDDIGDDTVEAGDNEDEAADADSVVWCGMVETAAGDDRDTEVTDDGI